MGRNRVVRLAATALALAMVLGGCASAPGTTPTAAAPTVTATPFGDGVLRVGTLIPTTGTFAFLGPAQAAGVALAVQEINAAGGVNGKPVEVLPRDSGDAGSTTAEASLADLVSNRVDVIIGPSSSVLAERLGPAIAKAQVAMISPAATLPAAVAKDSGYFFRTVPAYGRQGSALGEVLSAGGPVKVALVYVDDRLGRAIVPTLTASLAAAGSRIVAAEAVSPTATDLAPRVAAVVAAKPDAVVLASAYSSLDLTKAMITQLIGAGFGGAKLWLTTQNAGDYSQALPAGLLTGVNGIIEGVQPDDAFIARLKTIDPGLSAYRYAAEAYDATILAALAAIVAGDDSGRAIAATLTDVSRGGIKCTSFAECLSVLKTQHDIDYDGVSGPVNFTAQGDVSPAYYGLYTFNGENKFVFARGIVAG